MELATRIGSLALVASLSGVPAAATVRPGEDAPMYVAVDENMQLVDMADFIDGTPLVFLYGSAT